MTALPFTSSTKLMGIINVTPDSFSDGGQFIAPAKAIAHGATLWQDGADILDVGAESTRPGATPLSSAEEWTRLEPVLKGLRKAVPDAVISLDSRRPETILKALPLGIDYVNNVDGVAARPVLEAIQASKSAKGENVKYIAMHIWQNPEQMMHSPLPATEALNEVGKFYQDARAQLSAAGFGEDEMFFDPGIGFGKTDGGNLQLLRDCLVGPYREKMVVGLSRKSLMGRLLGIASPEDRDLPSKMFELALLMAGVYAIRTHDIKTLHTLRSALHSP